MRSFMISKVEYRYHSLEDFLISTPLTIDGQLDDGWGASYPVKGREIEATILFADISGFSRRTLQLTPAETLIFVNNFFVWISAEALRSRKGIVDKYIGDEITVLFSKEFGSEDAFVDALTAARWMAENDAWSFCPHIGIASGPVIVGYVGTPIRYNCSVFGAPVARAARCAGVRPETTDKELISTSIVFPSQEWEGRNFDHLLPPRKYINSDGTTSEQSHSWVLRPERSVSVKNIPSLNVRELVKTSTYFPSQRPEDRAKAGLRKLRP
jgi:hypothetical protein